MLTNVFKLWYPIQSMRRPKLFWVSAAAPLTSVILSTLLVFFLKSKVPGISIVRTSTLSYKFPDKNQYMSEKSFLFRSMNLHKLNFWHTDWSLTKGSESTFIKYAVLPWLLSCSCYQNWHCNWNLISHCKWSKTSLFLYQIMTMILTVSKYFRMFTHVSGRNSSGKDICFSEKLPSWWQQRNDGYWLHEHGWFLFFMLCDYRWRRPSSHQNFS